MDIDISEIESKNERGLYNSLPLRGGRWRRRRRMRAESSFLYPPNKRDSRTLQKIRTSQTKPKTSPMSPPLFKNKTNLRFLSGGVMGGSSGKMREVWREKKPHPKGGFFSLQGLSPFPFPLSPSPLPPYHFKRHRAGNGGRGGQNAERDERAGGGVRVKPL